jgi:hypothetical protein
MRRRLMRRMTAKTTKDQKTSSLRPATAREEVFWSLAVLAIILLMRRLLMRVFSAGLRSSFYPWA